MDAQLLQTRNRHFAVAIIGVVIFAAASTIASYVLIHRSQLTMTAYYWIRELLTAAALAWTYTVLPQELRPDLKWRRPQLAWAFAAFPIAGALGGISFVIVFTFQRVGIYDRPVFSQFAHAPIPIAFALMLIVGVISPIVQELVFRGWLFSGLRRGRPFTTAMLASAAVFALLHVTTGLPQILNSFLFGLAMAAVFERSRSIVPCCIIHVLINSASVVAAFSTMTARV